MTKNGFEYYHIVKNEDAHPFSHLWEKGDGFLVAADGLGGSGSTIHRLTDEQYAKLADTLPGLILPEYYSRNVTFMTAACEEEARYNPATEMYEVDPSELVEVITTSIESAEGSTDETLDEKAEDAVNGNGEGVVCELTEETMDAAIDENVAREPSETPSPQLPIKGATPFDKWLEKQFSAMIDDTPDTSALWGSRIAISRFSFYMLAYPQTDLSRKEEREALTAFIYKGMQDVANHYGLSAGGLSGQSVLPTTLVGMKFKVKNDDQILVETVWAGDSRAYAFIPGQGMKQLSVDDEDESGAICNLFSMGRSNTPFATDLHYAAYCLPAKSAIFVCSDGVFDPYAPIDNIGVEAMFLEALKDADSYESLGNAWYTLYSPMQHDDTSVAFRAFGFESFEEFKGNFLPAYEDVLKAYNGYHNGKKIYPIIIGEEEKPQIYVEERAAKRTEQIAEILANAVLNPDTPSDATVTPSIRLAYDVLKRKRKCEEVKTFLLEDPSQAERVFRYPSEDAKDACSMAVRKLIDCARSVQADSSMLGLLDEKLKEIIRKGDALAEAIDQRIQEIEGFVNLCNECILNHSTVNKELQRCYSEESYKDNFDETNKVIRTFYTGRRNAFVNAQKHLRSIFDCWESRSSMADLHARAAEPGRKKSEDKIQYHVFLQPDLHFFREMKEIIDEYLDIQSKQKDYCDDYSLQQRAKYQEAVQSLEDTALAKILSEPEGYLTEMAQSRFGDDVEISRDELTKALVNMFKNSEHPEYFNEVITALSTSATPTILDCVFNPGRLNLARNFNRFDPNEVLENRRIVETMLADYEDVKAWSVG